MSEPTPESAVPAPESAAPTGEDHSDELVRAMTHRQITMVALGSALGTGLFLGSATAIGIAGPAVIVSYAIGAVIAGILGFALGEMSVAHPVRGAFGAFAQMYLGGWAGFLSRWAYWASAVIAVGSEVTAGAIYVRFWWPQIPLIAGIVVFAAAIVGVNLLSVHVFAVTEYWFSTIKVTALIVFILIGIVLIFFGVPGTPATGFGNLVNDGGFFPNGAGAVWLSMAVVLFSFVGVEVVSITAAEAADPKRSVRTAMRQLVWRLAIFYVGAITVVVTVIPWQETAAGTGDVQSSPFVAVFSSIGIPAAATITNAVVLIAALSAANANLYGSTRLMYSLGRDRLAPRWIGRLNRKGVPVPAVLVSAIGLAIAAGLAASGVEDVFLVLISLAIFAVMLVWVLILASYISFRRRQEPETLEPDAPRMWGGVWTAGVGIALLVAVLATGFVVPAIKEAAIVGLTFCAIVLIVYAFVSRRSRSAGDVESRDRQNP